MSPFRQFPRNMSIKAKAVKGVALQTALTFLTEGVRFARGVILARLLLPEEFGLAAFAMTIVGFAGLVGAPKIGGSVVQTRNDEIKMMNTAFTLQLVISVIPVVILMLFSDKFSVFFARPTLGGIVTVLSFTLILDVMRIPRALLVRNLQFFASSVPETVTVFAEAGFALWMAWTGWGVWSLVISKVAASVAGLAVLYLLLPCKPRLSVDPGALSEMLEFSVPVYLFQLLAWLYANGDDFLVGYLLGDKSLGYYARAFYLPQHFLLARTAMASVTFAAYSKLSHDRARVSEGFSMATKYSAIVMFMFSAVCIPLAGPVIVTLFGSQWLPAAAPFAFFMGMTAVDAVMGQGQELFMSKGKTRTLLYLFCTTFLPFAVMAVPMTERFGIMGMTAAVCLSYLIGIPFNVAVTKKIVSMEYIAVLWRPFLAFLVSAALGFALKPFASGVAGLGLVSACVTLLFWGVLLLLEKGLAGEACGWWRILKSRGEAAPGAGVLTEKNIDG